MNREPRAVLLLLGLAVLAHAVRLAVARPGAAPGALLAPEPPADADPARQRERSARAGRALGAGETIDLNAAPADEIARLPRIGMSLAKRIVADRTSRGPFRSLEDLGRVSGVGSTVRLSLQNRVRFGAVGVTVGVSEPGATVRTSEAYATRPARSEAQPVDLNSASEADLVSLPGIGAVRARAIVAYRREAGPFAGVLDLGRVPGFSHALVTRLAPLLTVR
jgi:competence protein ComEA